MSDIAELQAAFAAALGARDLASADVGMLRGSPRGARRRLGFYRGNVQANAHKALRSAFPVCERLVGETFFEGMARAYASAEPSLSGDLNAYGAQLPAFIRGFAPAASLPYLTDVAALEWCVHRAHYAADRPPLDLREVAALPPDRFGDLRAVLHPACALLVTPTPAVRIWAAHQPGSDGQFAVDPHDGPDRGLVHRPAFRVEATALDPAPFAFLVACEAARSLDAATRAAQALEPEFALEAHLAGWARDRVIVELRLP